MLLSNEFNARQRNLSLARAESKKFNFKSIPSRPAREEGVPRRFTDDIAIMPELVSLSN